MLEKAIAATIGVVAPCETVSFDERRENSRKELYLISEARVAEFQKTCVTKIEALAASGSMLDSPHMLKLLYYWREWAGEDVPKRWSAAAVRAGNAAAFLTHFVQRGTTTGMGDYVSRIREYIHPDNVSNFIALEIVEKVLKDVRIDELPANQKKAVSLFRKALLRQRSGKPVRRPPDYGDDEY